ncbi:VOC family protein [Lichenicola sp.]|uniref:VOC family protein n=1 Tax=Lichenicola sp. TaxID=2804529 RepID=UPI003B007D0C
MIIETFTRVFVDAGAIEPAIAFYRTLLGGRISLRFTDPDVGLKLAAVSSTHLSVLIIAGAADRRAPFEATRLTIQVDRLEPYRAMLEAAGAIQLDPVQPTPVGRKMRYRHADGLVVEYVDHDAGQVPPPSA